MRNALRPVASLGAVSAPTSVSAPVRVVRARWRHSDYRSAFLAQRVREDGPKVAPGGKVYGEWLAALVDEFGSAKVAGWSSEKELPLEWGYGVWRRSRLADV